MKLTAVVILFTCLSCAVRADDQATPTPTPIYLHHLAPPGTVRRMEQLDRQHALEAETQTRAEARQQARTNRRLTAVAEAQAQAAAQAKERAQQQVDQEARRESAKATPKSNSDLMKQMGFSDQEVAAQKAREESARGGTKTPDTTLQTEHRPDPSKANATTTEKPTSASPAPQTR